MGNYLCFWTQPILENNVTLQELGNLRFVQPLIKILHKKLFYDVTQQWQYHSRCTLQITEHQPKVVSPMLLDPDYIGSYRVTHIY